MQFSESLIKSYPAPPPPLTEDPASVTVSDNYLKCMLSVILTVNDGNK